MKEETTKDMGNYLYRQTPKKNRGEKNSVNETGISKMHFCIGFLGIMLLAINIFSQKKVSKKEIADLDQFSEYYGKSYEENGGIEISDDLFYTFKRTYDFKKNLVEETDENSLASSEDVPVLGDESVVVAVNDASPEIKVIEYTVMKNDTYESIAKAHNTKAEYIKVMNKKGDSNVLKEGEKLTVITENAFAHKIVSGDNLGKIATRYRVSRLDIEKINNVDPRRLRLGSTIYVQEPNLSQVAINAQKERERNDLRSPRNPGKKAPARVEPQVVDSGGGSGSGGFRYPVATRQVSSKYGNRFHPVLKRYIMHTGVDLAARYVPLTAAKEGTVSFAGTMGGYGKIIIIKHSDGYESRYAHLQTISVAKGAVVKAGQNIGVTGRTGRVTGPHLHFEIRKNGNHRNPMNYLK